MKGEEESMDDRVMLELNKYEYGVVFHSLNDKRNEMLKEKRPTDAVDDVLLKVIGLREVLTEKEESGDRREKERTGRKERSGWRRHEER